MKKFLKYFYYTFPIQLLLLHFRKAQLLLVPWFILFSTITGHFMKLFGADGLFLAPEYLGSVNELGAAIVGIACGVFFMSWNITTFILHSNRFRFLAATSNPFLRYCLNNAIIPILFLIIYCYKAFYYSTNYELITVGKFFLLMFSFIGGLFLLLIFSFAYFFTADKRIVRSIQPGVIDFNVDGPGVLTVSEENFPHFGLPVTFYASSFTKFRKARDVSHYSLAFLDSIFKRHHFSAMVTILMAFIFLLLIGFFLDHRAFQVPAGASIFIIFAVLTAVVGALGYFLRSWGLIFIVLLYLIVNTLHNHNILNISNKAYGLDYRMDGRPAYSLAELESLKTPAKTERDKANMISILDKWKKRQREERPLMIMLNFSGGGLRGASFAMNVLQQLDSSTGGALLRKSVLMSGASGGMLSAAYFRELYRQRQEGRRLNLRDKSYFLDISQDLLNPVFSSMIARDFISPTQKFKYNGYAYVKDRGFAFEQKLNANTKGLLNHDIGFYKAAESNAEIPLLILNSVITRDMKKMIVSTQPVSFLMQETNDDSIGDTGGPDAIDFGAMFHDRSPLNLRLLTALRMNATYPYILPAVWLPTSPVIDVMDAGLRDNFGQETSLRFMNVFKDWIDQNTRGVLIIEMRSKKIGSWSDPYSGGSILDAITRPFSMLQTNWFNMQDYLQNDDITYAESIVKVPLQRVLFMYEPAKEQAGVPLNFHLTASEKMEVEMSLSREVNKAALKRTMDIINNSGGEN